MAKTRKRDAITSSTGKLPAPAGGRYSISAVANALSILDKIVALGVITLDEAAAAADVSRSTAYRLLVTLTDFGLVERLPGGGYQPGTQALRWAANLLQGIDLQQIALPVLRRLRETTSESANFALLRGNAVVYTAVLESPGTLRTVEAVGSDVPLYAAAIGKAVAAFLEPDKLSTMLPTEPYPRLTEKTITSLVKLKTELQHVRDAGYALDVEGVEAGVACVASPVFYQGSIAGAVSLSGPRARLTDESLSQLAPVVQSASEEISHLL
jgi:IclR family transcriptional regulator, acetate operon repressor